MKPICNLLLIVLMLSLTGITIGCTSFQLSSLEILPQVCLTGETVTVSATLVNISKAQADYDAELLVNGATEQTQTLTVEPGASQTLSFTLTKSEPGSYTVKLGSLSGSFTVLGARNFRVMPAEVEVGKPVTVSAELRNTAESEAAYNCCLLCQGEEVETRSITLGGGATDEVSFTLSHSTPGTYYVRIGNLSGSFKVLKPAEFVVSDFSVAPNPVKVGEATTITLNVTNIGEVQGIFNSSLLVDGAIEEARNVTLGGGATELVSLSLSRETPGIYRLKVGEQTAVLQVVQPVRLSNGTYILREMDYGSSKLKIINNRDSDVVIVLSSPDEPQTPLLAFYVWSNATCLSTHIMEGTFILYYTFGEDWDNDGKRFLTPIRYGRFDEELDFEETAHSHTIWTVTFGIETGEGTPTTPLDEDEFPGLG